MIEGQERILVVDDDHSLLTFLSRSLRKHGYDVTTANDGFHASEVLAASPPFSVLVTDMMMPKMSGLELIRRARTLDENIEIIVITATDSVELAIVAMRDGRVHDYLQKPLASIDELTLVVDRAANHRRLVMERAALQEKAETEAHRLQALVSNVGEAILVVAGDGTIMVANPSARKLLTQDDLEGRRALDVLPHRLVSIVENWQAVGGKTPIIMEMPWPVDTVLMLSLTPVQEQNSSLQGWALVLRDITPFKRLDELKTQAMIEAASKIRRPLAEAMSALVDLNVLAAQDDRMADSVFKLSETWKRIQAYGDELLKMARQESSTESVVAEVDLNQVLGEIEKDLNTEMYWQGKGNFAIIKSNELPTIQTDLDMLSKLIKGVLKRAIVRSPLGGQIRVDAKEIDGKVYIDVSDEGAALTDTGVLRMFDKSIVDPAMGNAHPGSELAQAKAQLERVGGQLWVGGKTRRGSTITICIPAVAQPLERRPVAG